MKPTRVEGSNEVCMGMDMDMGMGRGMGGRYGGSDVE